MIYVTLILLAILEVSLSFDNAIVNAKVLVTMNPVWRRRFMTWGLPVAVLGMRLIFPALVVAGAGQLSLGDVTRLIFQDPAAYAAAVASSHVAIASFGGLFLLNVFLGFLDDEEKEHCWLNPMESWWQQRQPQTRWELRVLIPLGVIYLLQVALPWQDKFTALVGSVFGMSVYWAIDLLLQMCGDGQDPAACALRRQGFMRFIYLEVLDASFSLDGVMGAFALTDHILLIMAGLGIGAAVIRGLTLKLVRDGTLREYVYLEHGAHWSVGALAACMLAGTLVPVPQALTGLLGAGIIALALISSIRYNSPQKD